MRLRKFILLLETLLSSVSLWSEFIAFESSDSSMSTTNLSSESP